MKDLQIEPTKKTPLIDFFTSGKLIFAGSAYPENVKEFFDPIIDWIVELDCETVDFDLIIEYINTSAAKKLLELLQKLQANDKISSRRVNWFYQKWDEDGLETGQILSDSLPGISFEFVEFEKKDE
jgi:hypothetical protein